MGTSRISYLLLLLLPVVSPLGAQRRYWKVSVDSLAAGLVKHTHVEVTGRVQLIRKEADGDTHLKITGVKGFIVAECIPALPCSGYTLYKVVTVRGISRYDGEHKWWEVHPVEELVAYSFK